MKAGRCILEEEALAFCKKHKVKAIPCRWVTNAKPESAEGVRARIVVKDIAKGSATAKSLAISSPTPSIEALRVLMTTASGSIPGIPPLDLYAMDVSQAFTNSPLPKGARICVKMPLSVSTPNGEPVYMEA